MKMKIWPAVLVVLLFCGGPTVLSGQRTRRASELVGTWRLVATQQRLADGTVRPEVGLGPHGVGYIMYSDTGVMCAFLSNPDRPRWKVQSAPLEAELRSAFNGMVAYCGTYEVNETEGYVVHHIEMDKVPNLAGTDRKRYFTLTGSRLILRPAPPLPEGVQDWTIVWERVEK